MLNTTTYTTIAVILLQKNMTTIQDTISDPVITCSRCKAVRLATLFIGARGQITKCCTKCRKNPSKATKEQVKKYNATRRMNHPEDGENRTEYMREYQRKRREQKKAETVKKETVTNSKQSEVISF